MSSCTQEAGRAGDRARGHSKSAQSKREAIGRYPRSLENLIRPARNGRSQCRNHAISGLSWNGRIGLPTPCGAALPRDGVLFSDDPGRVVP